MSGIDHTIDCIIKSLDKKAEDVPVEVRKQITRLIAFYALSALMDSSYAEEAHKFCSTITETNM